MNVLLTGELDAQQLGQWRELLEQRMPEARWCEIDEGMHDPAAIDAAVVANPTPGILMRLPNLRLIQSLWAGVDRLLADATLPAGVPVARMVDPAMSAAMAETALWATLSLHRGYFVYQQRQAQGLWEPHAQRRADEVPVLVLGQGEMGRTVAQALARQGYRVRGWRANAAPAHSSAVEVIAGMDALHQVLASSEVVINLLPLTDSTRSFLDAALFARLPRGASVVNLGRGGHLVDADLLDALDRGHLAHAVLDVFHTEPLPPEHPFWHHPKVTMLPHAAAATDPRSASDVVVRNLRALHDGAPIEHLVNRERGY